MQNFTDEPVSSRESTPHLLEPLNYEIIQLDDDDDEEEDAENNGGEHEQQQELLGDDDGIEEMAEIKNENQSPPPIFKNINKTNRSTNNSHHNLCVDISRSIKWHEIIQENNHETQEVNNTTPKLKKKKLN